MAMTEVYRTTIDAPPANPPRYSLLTAVGTLDEPSVRWQGGIEYVSELGPPHGAEQLADCLWWTPGGVDVGTHLVSADPIVVWAESPCRTTLGNRNRDWQAEARRRLNAYQSFDIARTLWLGWRTEAGGGGGGISTGGRPVVTGIAELEDMMAQGLQGVPGVILAQPGALAAGVAAGAFRLDGARYVSPMGHTVAADAGFAGIPIDNTAEDGWLLGTGPIRIRLGAVEVDEPVTEALTNTVTVRAWRPVLVEVDRLTWEADGQGDLASPPWLAGMALYGATGTEGPAA